MKKIIEPDDKILNEHYLLQIWNEYGYLNLLRNVLNNGNDRIDRTGVGTRSLFAPLPLKFNLQNDTLPLLTTKKVPIKAVIKELLWFLRGDTDAKILQDQGVHIWDGNTSREFLDSRGLTDYPKGILGPGYGWQWRHFGAKYDVNYANTSEIENTSVIGGFDQVKYIENLLKTDPYSRRIYLSAWNAADLDKMSLLPCHISCQFYVSDGPNESELSCHMYQRSVDTFLGLPFNIASYAILTHLLAKKCGLKAKELTISFGDTHIYNNHMDQVKMLFEREPYKFPTVQLDDSVIEKDYHDLVVDDFKILNYQSHSTIKAKMAI